MPGILGPGPRFFTPSQLSVEFVNVGGWLTSGDLALDSCAQFLAVAEHRLIPSRARLVITLFGLLLVRIGLLVVMLGLGVVSLGGCSLSLPSVVTPQFQEFFRLGRVSRTTLPTAQGGVVSYFCCLWLSGG